MGKQSMTSFQDAAWADPGRTDWPDGGGGPPYKPLQTTPNKRTWTLFALAGLCGLNFITIRIQPELLFVSMLLLYLGGTYTWYNHNEDIAERNKVLDTIERI